VALLDEEPLLAPPELVPPELVALPELVPLGLLAPPWLAPGATWLLLVSLGVFTLLLELELPVPVAGWSPVPPWF
jgi:hypothetical protein